MALPPPPRHLSRQRAHNAKYSNREQAKNTKKRREAIAAFKAAELERKNRKSRKVYQDSSPTTSSPMVTITGSAPGLVIIYDDDMFGPRVMP